MESSSHKCFLMLFFLIAWKSLDWQREFKLFYSEDLIAVEIVYNEHARSITSKPRRP